MCAAACQTLAIYRSPIAILSALTLLGLLACTSDPETPLDLAERLEAGQVRAGTIQKKEDLLGGPTAEGKVGDYKLYNSKIAVIVESPGPSHGYDIYGGKIADADIIRPKGELGASNFGEMYFTWNFRTFLAESAELINDGSNGEAAHLRVKGKDDTFPFLSAIFGEVTDAMNLKVVVDYILEPDVDHLKIVTTVETRDDRSHQIGMHYTGFLQGNGLQVFSPKAGYSEVVLGQHIDYLAAVADKVSYSFFDPHAALLPLLSYDAIQLLDSGSFGAEPGEPHVTELYLVVGSGDLQEHEASHRALQKKAGEKAKKVVEVKGEVREGSKGIANATVHVLGSSEDEYLSQTRADHKGRFSLQLPEGRYQLRATAEGRDPGQLHPLKVPGDSSLVLDVGPVGTLKISATEDDQPIPVKVQARRNPAPEALSSKYGLEKRHKGYERVEFLLPESSELKLAPGQWTVYVSRGFEYEVETFKFELKDGQTEHIKPKMRRVVDTTGWVSGDFHIHTQFSPDSDDLVDHKMIAVAAENVEVPISTEHDHISDFQPVIKKLGLERFARSVVGIEVSTVSYGHFGAFPLKQDPTKPNYGALDWVGVKGDDLMKEIRKYSTSPIIQVNHPRSGSSKGFFDATKFNPITFKPGDATNWSIDYDAVEIANRGTPNGNWKVLDDWFAFFDRGIRLLGTGNSDTHTARSDMIGYPRNYVKTGEDRPHKLNMDEFFVALRAGKLAVSGGIFVETESLGHGSGALVPMAELKNGVLPLRIRVQAPSWVPVGDVEVMLNGESALIIPADELDHEQVLRLERVVDIQVPSEHDSYVMVRVLGAGALDPVHPGAGAFGFTNPVFVDANGNGKFDARIPYP